MNRFDLEVVGSDECWLVMCGRNVFGRYGSEEAARAAVRQEGSAFALLRMPAADPRGVGEWENEGGATSRSTQVPPDGSGAPR